MSANPIALWEEDPEFLRVFSLIADRVTVDQPRCFVLWQLARATRGLQGDFAEVGVYRGGTARLLSDVPGKTVHLFDTFAGMPETDPLLDLHRQGQFADTSAEEVALFLAEQNVILHPGLFQETADSVGQRRFACVHVDADIHASVRAACEFFAPRMTWGGIIVFDDYGFLSCPGAKLAVDEYYRDRRESLVYLPTGQCLALT